MSSFTSNTYQMKRKILSFTNKIPRHLSKPEKKFTADITYGIPASYLHQVKKWVPDELNETYEKIGRIFDTTKFSDEYCKYGEFTGTMVGITCADRVRHQHYADFDFFEYISDEAKAKEKGCV